MATVRYGSGRRLSREPSFAHDHLRHRRRGEVVERERDVGGIFYASLPHSPVYQSAHLISSKPLTQFPDFPMPREYPDYPDHGQALEYLRA